MIYRKGENQSDLFTRAKEQESTHVKSDADSNGYIVGLNPDLKVSDVDKGQMGDFPVSAKGIRMGQDAKHWKDKYPHMWGKSND
jgi:hypothetical protein